jgi:hypothetical protein
MAAGVAQTMIQRRETKLHRLLLLIIMIKSFVARVITLLLNSPSARHKRERESSRPTTAGGVRKLPELETGEKARSLNSKECHIYTKLQTLATVSSYYLGEVLETRKSLLHYSSSSSSSRNNY